MGRHDFFHNLRVLNPGAESISDVCQNIQWFRVGENFGGFHGNRPFSPS